MILRDIRKFKMNKINFDILDNEIIIKNNENNAIDHNKNIIEHKSLVQFDIYNKSFIFEYYGIKIISTNNTNKFIRNIICGNLVNSNIKISGNYIRHSNIIVISLFSRISDILNSRVNGSIHNYLKDNINLGNVNKNINNLITKEYQEINSIHKVTNLDFSKSDLINFIDVSNEYINEENFFSILEILKEINNKKTIIFNDIDFIKYNNCVGYIKWFNFIFVSNNSDINNKEMLYQNNLLITDKDNILYELE